MQKQSKKKKMRILFLVFVNFSSLGLRPVYFWGGRAEFSCMIFCV